MQAGFAGITDAIAAGNLALAGQIAVTSLQLVFETGLSAIRTLWTDWVYDLAGALVVIEIEARNVFSRVQTLVGAALEEIGDATGSAALKAAGTVTAGFGRARIAERESELRGRIGLNEDDRTGEQARLVSSLDGLRQRLGELRDQAAAERAAITVPEITVESATLDTAAASELATEIAAATEATADKIETTTRGTFSSFAARRMNVDNTALMKQQVVFLQRIAANTSNIQNGTFGP